MSYSKFNPNILNNQTRLRTARRIVSVLKDYFQDQDTSQLQVLDIGCSSGVITNYLADYFRQVIGIDTDQEAISLGKKIKERNVDFFNIDGTRTQFPKNSFDVVICNQVYYYINQPQKLFMEIYRVLKPGGICYLAGKNKYTLLRVRDNALKYYLSYWELKNTCGGFTIHRYTPRVIRNLYKIFQLLPISFLEKLEPISPNFIWILEKPRSRRKQSSLG